MHYCRGEHTWGTNKVAPTEGGTKETTEAPKEGEAAAEALP